MNNFLHYTLRATCFFSFTLAAISTIKSENLTPIPFIDFDSSMQKSLFEGFLNKDNNIALYNLFSELWKFTNPIVMQPRANLAIPKKLHFIWLGKPMPEEYNKYINSWREFHPDWEFKLWTEADVDTFNFRNRDIFTEANNYSRKADIWCLEILEQFGGLYLNVDFQCLKQMDTLHYAYDFYIAMQPLDTNIVQLGTGLIAAIPHHPLLKLAIENIRETRHITQIIVATGPIFFTKCYVEYIQNQWIPNKNRTRDVVLPASYFYPCGYTQRGLAPEFWYRDEAYAVHHWAGSWLSKDAFVPGSYRN